MSIGKLGKGQENYYLATVARGVEDYYTGAGESPGEWAGIGAAPGDALLVHGTVPPARLHSRPYYASRRLRAVAAGPKAAEGP